jgi:hypothetical protein
LGSQNRLHKRRSTGHVDKLTIPSWKLPGAFVLKVLEVPSSEAPNQKGEPMVSQREGCTGHRDPLKDIIKVNSTTPNRDHGALREVCAKTGNFPKALQNGRKVLHILLDWSHKNRRIVRI